MPRGNPLQFVSCAQRWACLKGAPQFARFSESWRYYVDHYSQGPIISYIIKDDDELGMVPEEPSSSFPWKHTGLDTRGISLVWPPSLQGKEGKCMWVLLSVAHQQCWCCHWFPCIHCCPAPPNCSLHNASRLSFQKQAWSCHSPLTSRQKLHIIFGENANPSTLAFKVLLDQILACLSSLPALLCEPPTLALAVLWMCYFLLPQGLFTPVPPAQKVLFHPFYLV